jgi:hypothetical protein
MRKLIFAAFLALPLVACQTPGQVPSVSPVVEVGVGLLPDQVRDAAVKVCGYLPAAETVAQLIAAFGGPSVPGIASQIAAEICGAVTKPRQAGLRAAARPSVRGVAVKGKFVR